MESARQFALLACVAVSFSQAACVASAELEGDDEAVEEVQQAAITVNALTVNALTVNALTVNALTVNALTVNALTVNSLMGSSLTRDALRTPESRELLRFIVGCALPEEARLNVKIDGVSYSFVGDLGLAPEWGSKRGSCDEDCQEWVSACLLARVNYRGEHVMISLRGQHEALSSTKRELARYDEAEATYFGNVFQKPQRLFACLAPGKRQIPRVCGPSIDRCPIDVVGKCEDVCDGPRSDGSFLNCRDREPLDVPCGRGPRVFPRGADRYKASVSVFLE
ncbi:hypothetical protein WMF27_44110 [Sorangium sp. So ce281]|uniref:hypothetical protein n=1 Tax=unclassified Sorangium TaxID=2621164 RepID=UPI003F5E7A7C